MINDKKIEEAAVKSANYLKGICDFTVINAFEEGFKEGAKWAIEQFLKSLWHPASKEPEKFRKILYTGGSIDTTDTTMLITNNSWNTKVCLLEIKKWCYIDDLLLKEGCEQ